MNNQEIAETLKKFNFDSNSKIFIQNENSNSPEEFLKNYKNYDWYFMTNSDYSDCELLKIAESLCNKAKKTDNSEEFKLVGTAFENRFWGDESAIRFAKTPASEVRLLNTSLFVDYAADWLYKNRK